MSCLTAKYMFDALCHTCSGVCVPCYVSSAQLSVMTSCRSDTPGYVSGKVQHLCTTLFCSVLLTVR